MANFTEQTQRLIFLAQVSYAQREGAAAPSFFDAVSVLHLLPQMQDNHKQQTGCLCLWYTAPVSTAYAVHHKQRRQQHATLLESNATLDSTQRTWTQLLLPQNTWGNAAFSTSIDHMLTGLANSHDLWSMFERIQSSVDLPPEENWSCFSWIWVATSLDYGLSFLRQRCNSSIDKTHLCLITSASENKSTAIP